MTRQLEDAMPRNTNTKGPACPRCASVQLPGAVICPSCCANLTEAPASQPPAVAAAPVPVTVPAETNSIFASWPFGGADAEAVAEVAAQARAAAVAAGVRHELAAFATPASDQTAQNTTHMLPAIPAQRAHAEHPFTNKTQPEVESVPATGPNPFLAAARMLQARDEAQEAYSA